MACDHVGTWVVRSSMDQLAPSSITTSTPETGSVYLKLLCFIPRIQPQLSGHLLGGSDLGMFLTPYRRLHHSRPQGYT